MIQHDINMMMCSKTKRSLKPYLFLLCEPSPEGRKLAFKTLREMGVPVVAQFGSTGLELLATEEQAELIFKQGMFKTYSKRAFSREHLEKLSKEQQDIASIWNGRFSKEYQALKKDRTHLDKSWGTAGLKEPAPYTAIDPSRFREELKKIRKTLDKKKKTAKKSLFPRASKDSPKVDPKHFKLADIAVIEKQLNVYLDNPALAYHVARLWAYLHPDERAYIAYLPSLSEIIQILTALFAEDSCWEMHGEISVGIVFVESSRRNGPTYSSSERTDICNEILSGLSYLVSEHPSNNLSWVYDIQTVSIDVANQANTEDADFDSDSYWVFPAMEEVSYHGNTYDGSSAGIDDYREDMRRRNGSKHATVIFVTPYGTSWYAYSHGKNAIILSEHGDNWAGWGLKTLNIIAAHEMSHKFGAVDEYASGSSSSCSSCGGGYGCDNIPNGNCESCAEPGQGCIMTKNKPHICHYTRGHIGWSDIFVELWTADVLWAGTNDTVWLDIGDQTFELDSSEINDRERGDRQGYALWAGGDLSRDQIKRILIRKSEDGVAGGWKLQRVRVFHQGDVICDESPNEWLENRERWWVGCVTDSDIVHSLKIKVTTADVSWAGTNDDVTLEIAGRSWDLDTSANDFERGDTNTFNLDPKTGLYVDDIRTITIKKSSDGVAGGWKLKGVQLIVNGSTVYNNQSINKWLEDNDRVWSDGI